MNSSLFLFSSSCNWFGTTKRSNYLKFDQPQVGSIYSDFLAARVKKKKKDVGESHY